jgi:AcrR family transcriptional regulator
MLSVKQSVNRRGVATREALIDAALEQWAEAGWKVTSIATVADRVGVTGAGLLHHFGTKERFVLEVLTELDRRNRAYWESSGPPTGLDLIRALPEMTRRSNELPGLWKLHLTFQAENLDLDDPAYEYYVRRHHFIHRTFADGIRSGQERGEIRPDADPEMVAGQMLALLMGEGFHREHGPKEVDSMALVEDFANRLIRDLTAR